MVVTLMFPAYESTGCDEITGFATYNNMAVREGFEPSVPFWGTEL
jgi:hypothetical protein